MSSTVDLQFTTQYLQSQNETADEHKLEEWQKLLFPDGTNPLDKLIDSSSSSVEEGDEEVTQSIGVYQTKFHPRRISENERLEQDSVNRRVNRETAEFFTNASYLTYFL